MIPLALGTQTAGSIIRPASYCGVYGFKPTFGTVPRTGTLKTTDTLDSIGCFGRSIDDVALMFDTIRVKGRDYPYVDSQLRPDTVPAGRPLRIGYLIDGIRVFDDFASYTIQGFTSLLASFSQMENVELVKIIPSPEFNRIHDVHTTIYDKTLSYYFKVEFQKKIENLSPVLRQIIQRGQAVTVTAYTQALDEQIKLQSSLDQELRPYDIILTPAVAGEAPRVGEQEKPDTCLIWTFLGFPALSVPLMKGPNSLPIGIQAVAVRYQDFKLLSTVKYLLSGLDHRSGA
jgi:Asp-tRNA(Asn)/Glu-tRNA(Gln) amidotransferase A subunit family amidase